MKPMRLPKERIKTHRGLEPGNPLAFPESSYEAFDNFLRRGFGIEFDLNFTRDGAAVVVHDMSLKKITNARDTRNLSQITADELKKIRFKKIPGRIPDLSEVLQLIQNSGSKMNALHLKGKFQESVYINNLLNQLDQFPGLKKKILVFDVKPKTARYILGRNSGLLLAPSVAHPFDIERYNDAVGGTLMSPECAVRLKDEGLYSHVWLDEWDRTDRDGRVKKLYTPEVFSKLREAGYGIALVTPELHATSPGLLGGESHQDAREKSRLFARIREIIGLNPDYICTDFPEEFSA